MTIATPPTDAQEEALVAICLFAALADGENSDRERAEMRRVADRMQENLASEVSHKVLTGGLTLDAALATLTEASHRLLAYEMAVGVCESDGAISPSERRFLDDLRARLAIAPAKAAAVEEPIGEVALAPIGNAPAAPDNAGMILRYSILNGALELLPDTLATMAIIPLQMKMVYRVGKSYGVNLDSGHIKEFLATAGIGMTAQVVEGFARKFAKKLAKKFIGKVGGKIADQATGSAFSFASTYALGMAADKYYAGGRSLHPSQMREEFQNFLTQAREKYDTYAPQIQQQAGNLNPGKILGLIRDPAGV